MKKYATPILVLLVVALCGYVWWRMHPSEEKAVIKRVNRFAECVAKPEGETNTIMALKMNNLAGFFGDEVSINVRSAEIDGNYTGTDLTSQIARGRAMFTKLSFDLYDLKVTIDSPDTATALFTARVEVNVKQLGSQTETREVQATLRKADGVWQFTAFREEAVMVR